MTPARQTHIFSLEYYKAVRDVHYQLGASCVHDDVSTRLRFRKWLRSLFWFGI